ncbi:hypothetical protein [Bosea sp. (in: a-proteobacteria)]|uniref:hypothetical protein n=1 Tax=Bosea sp. (in: a-proteobacteria) TaxID=1871050 RepID=UPI003B3AFA9C
MLYLATIFIWFLAAAAVLGAVMGWVSNSSGKARLWSRGWTVIGVLWALGAVLAALQFVNGMAATWLETALLFVAVYWAGCAAGGLAAAGLRAKAPSGEPRTEPQPPSDAAAMR